MYRRQITIYLDPSLNEQVEEEAKAQGISINRFIRMALLEYFEKKFEKKGDERNEVYCKGKKSVETKRR